MFIFSYFIIVEFWRNIFRMFVTGAIFVVWRWKKSSKNRPFKYVTGLKIANCPISFVLIRDCIIIQTCHSITFNWIVCHGSVNRVKGQSRFELVPDRIALAQVANSWHFSMTSHIRQCRQPIRTLLTVSSWILMSAHCLKVKQHKHDKSLSMLSWDCKHGKQQLIRPYNVGV